MRLNGGAVEVLPHAPDAWIDHEKTKVGYEIPFNRHFYVFEPPRELADIDADLKKVTDRIKAMIEGLWARARVRAGTWRSRYHYKSFAPVAVNHAWARGSRMCFRWEACDQCPPGAEPALPQAHRHRARRREDLAGEHSDRKCAHSRPPAAGNTCRDHRATARSRLCV